MPESPVFSVSNQMLIRKPVKEVFQALIDPSITSKFWFSRGSDTLKAGQQVTWYWDMYGVSAEVYVKELVENKKVLFEWGTPKNSVEFTFTPITDDTTYVMVKNFDFQEEGDRLIEQLKDSMGGFTFLLSAMKAWLEHGIQLNLVADKYPPEVAEYFEKQNN